MPDEVSGFCPLSGQFAPNHEQHSYWQQIKPLHKRTFAHHFCKFGTGEDRQIEDARSLLQSLRERLFCISIDL